MKTTKKEYETPNMKTVWVDTESSILTLSGSTEPVEDVTGNWGNN